METSDMIGLAVVVAVGLGLVGLSVPVLRGKAAWLVAGYNTMSPDEKAQWDGPALARFTGKILLAMGVVTLPYGVGLFHFGWGVWLTLTYLAVMVGLSVFAAIWCNTGNRFRK